jgi:hypothetical protein
MDEEQEERQFTKTDLSNLRGLVRDIALLLDGDLSNSGHPAAMFGPFRLLLRQMLEAAAAYDIAHPDAVSVAARDEFREFRDSGWLDPDGVATVPNVIKITGEIGEITAAGFASGDFEAMTDVPLKITDLLADALDTAYKAGAGAPPSHGSRFARS